MSSTSKELNKERTLLCNDGRRLMAGIALASIIQTDTPTNTLRNFKQIKFILGPFLQPK
jgi:hypothetical protein